MIKAFFSHFPPEQLGWVVSSTVAFLGIASYVEIINGILQTIVLLGSVAVSIATVIYLRKKTKKL